MSEVNIKLIKELREKTGAGMMDCKKALIENDGDVEKAQAWLREQGILKASKKSGRIAAEGVVLSYIHGGGRVGVLIEVNIETDFAAKNEEFLQFVKDCAMQVAAMKPRWVSREEVSQEALDAEREIIRNTALNEGKPEKIVDKIVEGKMGKFYEENCLLDMPFVKDESKTVGELQNELIAKIGENIKVRRFTRYEVGEGIEKKEEDFACEVMNQIKQ
ncbi:MAG TPA: translation elongation factor Ts [Clostridiaceae bacterium]|nr:translation elongation factor Ts [Clostridiaceae bacterium]